MKSAIHFPCILIFNPHNITMIGTHIDKAIQLRDDANQNKVMCNKRDLLISSMNMDWKKQKYIFLNVNIFVR